MTTADLLVRAEERLNHTGSPCLPPEETLKAIIELGRERDEERATSEKYEEGLAELAKKLEGLQSKLDEERALRERAEDAAKEQEWIAHELGKFIRDVANRQYEGTEAAAAQRVFDLNGNSIKKKRRNAYDYDTLEDAMIGYRRESGVDATDHDHQYDFLKWLFSVVKRI